MLVSELAPVQEGTTIFYCAGAVLLSPARRPGGWAGREEVGRHGPPHLCGAGGLSPQRVVATEAPVSKEKGTLLALDKWLHKGNTLLWRRERKFSLAWLRTVGSRSRKKPYNRQGGRQRREKIGKAGKFKQEGNISRQVTERRAPVGRAPGKFPVIQGVKNVLSRGVLANISGGREGGARIYLVFRNTLDSVSQQLP